MLRKQVLVVMMGTNGSGGNFCWERRVCPVGGNSQALLFGSPLGASPVAQPHLYTLTCLGPFFGAVVSVFHESSVSYYLSQIPMKDGLSGGVTQPNSFLYVCLILM